MFKRGYLFNQRILQFSTRHLKFKKNVYIHIEGVLVKSWKLNLYPLLHLYILGTLFFSKMLIVFITYKTIAIFSFLNFFICIYFNLHYRPSSILLKKHVQSGYLSSFDPFLKQIMKLMNLKCTLDYRQ